MRKHSMSMTAAWAKDYGISGYDHYDPKVQEKRRLDAIKAWNKRNSDVDYKSKRQYNK